jgi:hypothetical protein
VNSFRQEMTNAPDKTSNQTIKPPSHAKRERQRENSRNHIGH